jgi:Raf kinase inhibitor-like YbhB/YbcL family protein
MSRGARAVRVKRGLVLAAVVLALTALLVGCSSGKSTPEPTASPDAPKGGTSMLTLSSPAFESGGLIPVEYANTGVPGGENVSIPYEWGGSPDGTRSFALILVDRHRLARSWVHWMVTSISADATSLARGASGTSMPPGSVEHKSTFGTSGYGGPQPPTGTGKHEYEAVLYALDTPAVGGDPRTLAEFNAAIDGHVLASASTSGMFGR